MVIRNATYKDAPTIKVLLEALGYKTSTILLVGQLEKLTGHNDHQVLVYELNKNVLGFIAFHYLPQLGFDGELAIITYLSVDETASDQPVGEALEQFMIAQAFKRRCDRIQVHVSEWRAPAHRFYKQQGYQEYPNYYTKRLIYGE